MSDSPAAILFDTSGNPVGTVIDGVIYRLQVESKEIPALNATRTTIPSSASDVLIASSNPSRLNLIIYNNSDAPLYIGFGTTPVSENNFTLFVPSQADREISHFSFVGEIRGAWKTASGEAYITELT